MFFSFKSKYFLGCLCAASSLSACNEAVVKPIVEVGKTLTVWNQAYQENTEVDAIAKIKAGARNSYVLLDPFGGDLGDDITQTVADLQSKDNQVSAYISIGTGEDWRDDFAALRPYLVTRPWGEWAGEYFVSDPNGPVLDVMKARVDQIAAWGFDWVEFDNMDWAFDDDNRAEYGFTATTAEGTAYYQALCDYVHAKDMKCMAKSTVTNANAFDGVTYESYPEEQNWWDQREAAAFISTGKPMIVIHYNESNCTGIRAAYQDIYGPSVSFLCEDPSVNGYVRF